MFLIERDEYRGYRKKERDRYIVVVQARQHGRQPAPPSPHPHSPVHPAPTGVRAYSCQHWESRLSAPPPRTLSALEPQSPCDVVEVLPVCCACAYVSMLSSLSMSCKRAAHDTNRRLNRCTRINCMYLQKIKPPECVCSFDGSCAVLLLSIELLVISLVNIAFDVSVYFNLCKHEQVRQCNFWGHL